jgi:hypothetical protein
MTTDSFIFLSSIFLSPFLYFPYFLLSVVLPRHPWVYGVGQIWQKNGRTIVVYNRRFFCPTFFCHAFPPFRPYH